MAKNTGFWVLTVVDEGADRRNFLLGFPPDEIHWQAPLPNRSLVYISAAVNAKYYHAVPPAPGNRGTRWSLIFRCITEGNEP